MTTMLLPGADGGDALDAAVDADRRIARTEAEKFERLAAYLTSTARHGTDEPVVPGAERARRYGGPGTPAVSEFTACEVAAALGLSPLAASALVADVLDVTMRLPMLFDALKLGRVDAWKVRKVASATREFTEEQARDADFRLAAQNVDRAPLLARVTMSRLRQILEQIRVTARPDEHQDDVASNLTNRFVALAPCAAGVADLTGRVSIEDAARLEQRITAAVGWLRDLGDERCAAELRSVALGWLADPDRLGLLHDQVARRDAAAEPSGAESRRRRQLPATVLTVHHDRDAGTWHLDGSGPISRAEAVDILGHSRVVVRPVIDLADNPTYTGYVAPPRLQEQTALVNAGYCTFPSCNRPARRADYDHLVEYAAGGVTDARNGHRLCRYHHRAKTFAAWCVRSPAPGMWLWHSPDDRQYLVTAGTTTRLDEHHRHRRRRSYAA